MKVLFLMEDLCFGGTQKQNLELAARLDRSRFSPAMLTLTGETDLDRQAREAGIPLFHLGSGRKAAPFFFARLGRAIRAQQPDVIVPCTALPNIWGRLWGRALGIPVLGTVRGGGAPKRQHERFLWPLAAHIVCNSKALAQIMGGLGVPKERLSFIPNGVDTERFRPQGPAPGSREPLIVCVARLAGDKDHSTLLRAFALVAAKHPEARLRLVGEGPEEAFLKNLARSLPPDVAARVEFAGATDNPLPHYLQARVFALASLREGTPNVVLEAMACGVPVCATAAGGIPDLVGQGGLLCPPGSHERLAENLLALLENPALADDLGANGRKAAESAYSFESMTAAHEKILSQICNSE